MERAAADAMSCTQSLLRSLSRSRARTQFPDSDGDISCATGAEEDFVRVGLVVPVLVPLFAGFLARDEACPYEVRSTALRLICSNFGVLELASLVNDLRLNENVGEDLDGHLDTYEDNATDDADSDEALRLILKTVAPALGQSILKASVSTASKTWAVLQHARPAMEADVGISVGAAAAATSAHTRAPGRGR